MYYLAQKIDYRRNRMEALFFALFAGAIGAQRFYFGQIGQGILCILFCWTFIPAIIGFIEAICLLCMSDKSFNQKYNDRYRLR